MGKGKKKGGGKATTTEASVEASVSSLTLDESRASTSQAPKEEGLTGKPQKEKSVEEKPQETSQLKPEPKQEEGGLGLLSASKKSRPRKKKPSQAAQEAAQAEPVAKAQPVASAPQQAVGGLPGFPTPGPPRSAVGQPGFPAPGPPQEQATQWSRPRGASGPPPPGAAPWATPAPTQIPVSSGAPGPPPPGAAPWATPAPTQMPVSSGASGPPPPGAAPWATPVPAQMPVSSGAPGPPPPGAAPWATPAPTQMPVSSGLTGQLITPSTGPPQRPSRPAFVQPQASGDKKPVLPKSRMERECKFIIPAKILGRSVPCNKVEVITNYLPMIIKPIKVHRYDLLFEPDKPRKMIPEVYKIIKKRLFPNEVIAFDMFKNAYCLNQLSKNVIEDSTQKENRRRYEVDYPDPNGRIMKFVVSFKYTGFVDFAKIIRHMDSQGSSLAVPMEEVQCMDVILRQGTLESYVKCGRNFFKRPDRPIDLSGGLEMWTGLFQSAIFTSRPFINIDVAHKGFPIQQSVLDAWRSFNLDLNRPMEQQMGRSVEGFKDFTRNLRVLCKLVGGASDGQSREFIVNSVKEQPTRLTFSKDDGSTQTVYDYYLKDKKYKIKYPNLPCLWVGARNKNIYYPLELCTVVYGQAMRKQLNEFQLATMVREAATPPDDRKRKIEEVARNMNYSQNQYFKKFGLEISNQFLQVEAKVLTAPTLNCGESQGTFPRRGAWNAQKLLKPEALVSWGFIGIELPPHQCNYDMIKNLILQSGVQLGMHVTEPKMVSFNVLLTELRAKLFKALEDEIRFLFIIVPGRGRDYYHKVKQFAETDVGILTQCIKEQTATRRMNHQTIKNILLKVNAKLMGINQCLDNRSIPRCIAAGGVMIVGADVTHPSPDQQNIPSIAAVTASIDPKCFIYNIELSIQSPKAEVIQEFEDMMYDHLRVYLQRNNNKPPRKIYVFRDGVSEGQFAEVLNKELTALLNAYAKFSQQKPEVLFLLVQKRHHTRLFGMDRTKKIVNVEPGTVVDTHIVHPKELDFYLVSHAAIKGTARPTRYHSVCNDGGIPHDEVEQLTYYLCHLYSRCMRAVSYPTPTYYAHLACLRARSLTHGFTFSNDDLYKKPQRLRVLDKMLRSSRMFFV